MKLKKASFVASKHKDLPSGSLRLMDDDLICFYSCVEYTSDVHELRGVRFEKSLLHYELKRDTCLLIINTV